MLEQLTLDQKAQAADHAATLQSLLRQQNMESYAFSTVSSKCVNQAIQGLSFDIKGRLTLPDLSSYMPQLIDISPYVWTERQRETEAAPELLELLSRWVKVGAMPPILNSFFDVQQLASHYSMEISVEGVGTFSGMPDVIVPHFSLRSFQEIAPISMSARLSIDWKSAKAFKEESKITAIGRIHALAFAVLSTRPVPVFFTDMVTGFRGWIVIDCVLYYLHPDNGLLSLADGVALIRYFLSQSAVEGSSIRVSNGTLVFDNAHMPSSSSFRSVEGGGNGGKGSGGDSSGGGSFSGVGTYAGSGGGGTDTKRGSGPGSGGGGSNFCRTRMTRKDILLSPVDSGEDDSDADILPETILAVARSLAVGGGMPRLNFFYEAAAVSPTTSPSPP